MSLESKKTLFSIKDALTRQNNTFSLQTEIDFQDDSVTASKRPIKPFTIYIGEAGSEGNITSLTLLINPLDLTVSSSHTTDNRYTRNGWVVGMWGKQQGTMVASGSTAAFYMFPMGLTRTFRKKSEGYLNFTGLLAFFKNNGWNFVTGDQGGSKTRTRVISVIDTVKVSYDGTIYEGAFSTLTFDEDAEHPFRFSYSFEFIISGLLGDKVEGHLATDGNRNSGVILGSQNSDLTFKTVVNQDEALLNEQIRDAEVIKQAEILTSFLPNSGSGSFVSMAGSDIEALQETAGRLGIPPEWLAASINHESRWSPTISNPTSTARGLIQFIDPTAVDLGYTSSLDLVTKNPTIREQLVGPVYEYLSKYGPFKSQKEFALAIFAPTYRQDDLNTVFSAKIRKANPGIVTVGDYWAKVKKEFDKTSAKNISLMR